MGREHLRRILVEEMHIRPELVESVPDLLLGNLDLVRDWDSLSPDAQELLGSGAMKWRLYKALRDHYETHMHKFRSDPLEPWAIERVVKLRDDYPRFFRAPSRGTAHRGTVMSAGALGRLLGHQPAITKRDRWTTEEVDGAVPARLHRSWSLNRKMASVFGGKARMRGWGVLDDAARKKQFQVILSADDLDQFVFNPKGMADLLGVEFPRRFEPSPAILAEREVVPCTSKVRVSQVKYRPVVKRTNPLVSALKF